jgi:hypothetical protein
MRPLNKSEQLPKYHSGECGDAGGSSAVRRTTRPEGRRRRAVGLKGENTDLQEDTPGVWDVGGDQPVSAPLHRTASGPETPGARRCRATATSVPRVASQSYSQSAYDNQCTPRRWVTWTIADTDRFSGIWFQLTGLRSLWDLNERCRPDPQ